MKGHPIALAVAISLAGVATGATAYAQTNVSFGQSNVATHSVAMVHPHIVVTNTQVLAAQVNARLRAAIAGLTSGDGILVATVGEGSRASLSTATQQKHIAIVESQFDKATN